MAGFLGVRALSTVHQHLEALKSKGYIEKTIDRERNVEPLKAKAPKLVEVPILGTIAAGLPIEAIEEADPAFASSHIVRTNEPHYALRVIGDSMIDDGVQDGDVVIVKAQNYISHLGQSIVAILDGGATLKRYGGLSKNGKIKLIPRNPKMEIIYANPKTFEVRGVLVGLIRAT